MAKLCTICNNTYIDRLNACPKESCIATLAAEAAAEEAAAQAIADAIAAAEAEETATHESNATHRKNVRKSLKSGQFKG